ncbi:cell division FtsZ family protein [Patescibacteria group bacterium]|nr:cell division FtsZ family protein [Patescibacteria group bacterium]
MFKKSTKQLETKKIILTSRRIKIKVIGIGGGGNSIVSEMAKNIKGLDFLVADTDQRSFQRLPSGVKIFEFGQEITKGWGTGMNLEIGEKAALAAKEKIKKIFQNTDLIILISCLGGGIGSGALPVFTKILNDEKKLGLGIFVLPFNFEGEKKAQMAQSALNNLKENLSGMIVLCNEEILKYSEKKVPLKKSLALMNQALIDYFQDLLEMVSQTGIINIDFADLQTILKGKGQKVFFGRALAQGPNRTEEALKELFENHFFGLPSKIKKILFNISAGSDLTLKEVEKIGEQISELNPNAKIIFGISQFPRYDKKIKITFLGTNENFFEKQEAKKEVVKEVAQKIVREIAKKQKMPNAIKSVNNEALKKEEKKFVIKQEDSQGCNIKIKSIQQKIPMSGQLSIPVERKKIKIRRSALEVKKIKQEDEEKGWEKDSDWETPSFLRKKFKNE